MVIVLAAQLDGMRIRLASVVTGRTEREVAKLGRDQLDKEIKSALEIEPFDRIRDATAGWLHDCRNLFDQRDALAHSTTFYEVRGDGQAGLYQERAKEGQRREQWSVDKYEQVIGLLDSTNQLGSEIAIQGEILAFSGAEAHANHLRQREEYQRRLSQLHGEELSDERDATGPT
jgi:hypothetical protein